MIYWTFNNCNTADVTGEPLKLSEEQVKFYLNPLLTVRKSAFKERVSCNGLQHLHELKPRQRIDKARQHFFLNTQSLPGLPFQNIPNKEHYSLQTKCAETL